MKNSVKAVRSRPGIDPEFEPISLAKRKLAVIGEQVDVEIILPDRREREAALVP
jgi:hypothetical protein